MVVVSEGGRVLHAAWSILIREREREITVKYIYGRYFQHSAEYGDGRKKDIGLGRPLGKEREEKKKEAKDEGNNCGLTCRTPES